MSVPAAILYIVVLATCGLGIKDGCAQDYPSVSFNLESATMDTYRDFLGELRARVIQTNNTTNGIPVLRPTDSVPVGERFVLVHLINYDGNVTLAIDVVNFYVVAFSANNRSFFFRNSTELQRNNLFVNTTRTSLGFTHNYNHIERAAGVGRKSIQLGPAPLAHATTGLWYCDGGSTTVAKWLLVVCQMVSEAARFGIIEERVCRSIIDQNTFTPDNLMLTLENRWSRISGEVQRAIGGENLTRAIELQDENFNTLRFDNYTALNRSTRPTVLLYLWNLILY